MDIYDPSTIHALITTAGDQDQQDICPYECVTVCVWTEGWCRLGHIVTMALFLVTTQRNNKQLSSPPPPPPPPPPPVYLRLRIHGAHTKTDYPAIYILQMKCFNPPRSVPS